MTEEEWLTSTEPIQLIRYLNQRVTDRRLRLFSCGVCRQLSSIVRTPDYLRGVEAAEALADGGRMKAKMKRCRQALSKRMVDLVDGSGKSRLSEWSALFLVSVAMSEKTHRDFPTCISDPNFRRAIESLKTALVDACSILRDIFGNPFRPVAFDPAWRTEHAVGMAAKMYDDRDFAAMPILADALQEVGCEDADILAHCREPGVHVRGCWVVDLLLGK